MDRIRIEIRINVSRAEDRELQAVTDDLKAERQLSNVVRQGIALIVDLRAGRTDVLFALFPYLRARIVQDNVQDKPRWEEEDYGETFAKRLMQVVEDNLPPGGFYRGVK